MHHFIILSRGLDGSLLGHPNPLSHNPEYFIDYLVHERSRVDLAATRAYGAYEAETCFRDVCCSYKAYGFRTHILTKLCRMQKMKHLEKGHNHLTCTT